MLQRKVPRMIPAEAASGYRQPRGLILPSHKRQKLVQYVPFILQMTQHPYPRMHALVVPALGIDGVGTKYLKLATLDLRSQHGNHPAIFVLEESPHRSREDHERSSRMSEHQSLHVTVEFLAVSLVKFAIHSGKSRVLQDCIRRDVACNVFVCSISTAGVSYPITGRMAYSCGRRRCGSSEGARVK